MSRNNWESFESSKALENHPNALHDAVQHEITQLPQYSMYQTVVWIDKELLKKKFAELFIAFDLQTHKEFWYNFEKLSREIALILLMSQ